MKTNNFSSFIRSGSTVSPSNNTGYRASNVNVRPDTIQKGEGKLRFNFDYTVSIPSDQLDSVEVDIPALGVANDGKFTTLSGVGEMTLSYSTAQTDAEDDGDTARIVDISLGEDLDYELDGPVREGIVMAIEKSIVSKYKSVVGLMHDLLYQLRVG